MLLVSWHANVEVIFGGAFAMFKLFPQLHYPHLWKPIRF
jgi:hypothetical protein